MEERSKTNKEIYEQKYPFKELSINPIMCAEAIGYLKALVLYFPDEKKWAISKIKELMITLLFLATE